MIFSSLVYISKGLAPLMNPITKVCGQSPSRKDVEKGPLLERIELLQNYTNVFTPFLWGLFLPALKPLFQPITDIVSNNQGLNNSPLSPLSPLGYNLNDLEIDLMFSNILDNSDLNEQNNGPTPNDIDIDLTLNNFLGNLNMSENSSTDDLFSEEDTDSHYSDDYLD